MATKKVASKKAAGKKAIGKAPAAKRSGAKATAAKEGAAQKIASTKSAARKTPAAPKAGAGSSARKAKADDNYTKPELREKIKNEVMAGDKGGRPGQWSARKAQLVAHEYVTEGGGYKHDRTEKQEHLKQWGDEKWHTADNKPAIQGDTTHQYLPDEAWKELSPEEKKATDEKKVRGSRKGKQFVPNTDKAKEARKHAEEE